MEHGERLARLETLIESIRDEYLKDIKEQVLATNGRVGNLEQRASAHRVWIYVLWIAMGGVVTLLSSHLLAK